MGENQARLLRFAIKYCNGTWSSYGHDRATVDAINSLARAGFIRLNEFRQFTLATGEYAYA